MALVWLRNHYDVGETYLKPLVLRVVKDIIGDTDGEAFHGAYGAFRKKYLSDIGPEAVRLQKKKKT
jgi:hypothetical protein